MDAGILEIYKYVPAALLPERVEDMDVECFALYLAKARYLEEIEYKLYLKAISTYFGDE